MCLGCLIKVLFDFSELSSRPSGGDLWPLAMTSMGMRQFGGGSELVVPQPSNEDLSSHCGSKLNLLEAGSLHNSNPTLLDSSNTHQHKNLAETRFNGTPQLSPGKS